MSDLQPIDPRLLNLERAAAFIRDQRAEAVKAERRREQAQAARILHGVCTGAIDQPAVPWEWALDVLWDRVTNGDGE